jgi:electron transfer flavoprotein beta subunit
MSKVFACYKWVIDEADIRIEGKRADFSRANWKIGDYDLNVIEAASHIRNDLEGSEAIGLTIGGSNAKASMKEALSRGLDAAIHVNSDGLELDDARITSAALAGVIASESETKLVICAEGSQDLFARQTAPRLAAALNWPVITAVSQMHIEDDCLVATRKLENDIETVKAPLPVVVSILPEINSPEYPKLKAIMAASKKPIRETRIDPALGGTLRNYAILADEGYVMNRKNVIINDGTTEERVSLLVESLKKEGVL